MALTKGARLVPLILVLMTVGCDRVTKMLATTNLAGTSGHSYFADIIRLEYAENPGAFLSMGTNLPEWARTLLFSGGVAVLLAAVVIVAVKNRWKGLLLAGAALLWAGGVSNLIDRMIHGSVVDFMNVGVGSLRTGIFNVADLAVMAGAALIFIESWRRPDAG